MGKGNRKIGVELVQWLNKEQIERSVAFRELERLIKNTRPPDATVTLIISNDIILCPKEDKFPVKRVRGRFVSELYNYLQQISILATSRNEEMQFNNFDNYFALKKYLNYIIISPSEFSSGISFIMGGSYSPKIALDTLVNVINKKLMKRNYFSLKKALSEIFLLIYYSKASYNNSPFKPDYDEEGIASLVRGGLTNINLIFDKIFLFFALEPEMKAFTLWPS